jgi:hypothetical protein
MFPEADNHSRLLELDELVELLPEPVPGFVAPVSRSFPPFIFERPVCHRVKQSLVG